MNALVLSEGGERDRRLNKFQTSPVYGADS